MTVLDGYTGDVIRCDRCGKIHCHDDSDFELRMDLWWYVIFKDCRKHWIDDLGDFCKECAIEVTPYIWEIRDIYELHMSVRKLERAINEKRKQGSQDHRTIAHHACQCREECNERRHGNRPCIGIAQAGEEHY